MTGKWKGIIISKRAGVGLQQQTLLRWDPCKDGFHAKPADLKVLADHSKVEA